MKVSERIDTADMIASFNGLAYHMEYLDGYSICAVWTGGDGTLKLQASNDAFVNNVTGPNNNENPNATWVDITGSSVLVSGAGSQFWNVSDVYYKAFRLVFTVGTPTAGDFTAHIHAKGVQ